MYTCTYLGCVVIHRDLVGIEALALVRVEVVRARIVRREGQRGRLADEGVRDGAVVRGQVPGANVMITIFGDFL
jgi:hypothetical protein